jgi:hypothetical protein
LVAGALLVAAEAGEPASPTTMAAAAKTAVPSFKRDFINLSLVDEGQGTGITGPWRSIAA